MLAAQVIPETHVVAVLKGYRDFSLAVEQVENAVLTEHHIAALTSALASTAGKLATCLIAHHLVTPKAAHVLDAAVSGATAVITLTTPHAASAYCRSGALPAPSGRPDN
ncbi:MAG: hypothetical protein ACREFS_03055 [Acetobacteraceae bacterium]